MNIHREKLRIKVLQYMYGAQEYFQWSTRINSCYCERHGYEYVRRSDVPEKNRHVNWHKIPVILAELHDCDYLLFMDADSHFYSHELTIERELIPLMGKKPILMAQDIGSEKQRWTPGRPNSGVILIKTNDDVRSFFEKWNVSSDVVPLTRWKWPLEQIALWNVIMPKFRDLLKVHPEYYMIQGRYGQYIRHYMLMSDEERLEKMKEFCLSKNIESTNE